MAAPYRLLKYPWHTAHDYELAKLPHQFYYLTNTPRRWAVEHRPVPANIRWVCSQDAVTTDAMILHLDQWSFLEPAKRFLFQRLKDGYDGPTIVINHGCNMVDGCSSERMAALVGDSYVVCNSATADHLWNLPRSRFIRHGMSPEEWRQTTYANHNILIVQPSGNLHSRYRNNQGIRQVEELLPITWVGRDIRFDNFNKYRHFLQNSSIFLNASFASPNPRARTEAMLSGLAVVTTNSHGEEDYIINGINGFCSNDFDEINDFLRYLYSRPAEVRKIGRAGRETAQRVFHIDRFRAAWNDLLREILG